MSKEPEIVEYIPDFKSMTFRRAEPRKGDYCIWGYDGCIQNDELRNDLKRLADAKSQPLAEYVEEKLKAVVQLNKYHTPED